MSPPDDPPVIQRALQIAQQAQQDAEPLVRAAVTQPKEPSVAQMMTRGTPIPPHAPDPTPAVRDAARADTRTGANHVNQRLDTIVPPSERVAGGVYKAGAPGGGRWADLPASVLQRKGLGFRKRVAGASVDPNAPPVPLPPRNHNQPPGPLPMAPTPGLGAAQAEPTPEPSDDDHLRRIWREAVDESSAAAKHAVATHNVRPTFTADDWHSALSLPFMDHLWYELSGEKLAENLPGLTHSEHMKMLDVLGATSARAKPDENLERTLAVMSQHMRGVPIDTDLTIPSTVKQALARDHKQGTSALPGNKTGHFSDTIALAGGVPSRYPISVNDVWVGRMFGVPDEVMSGNQSLHEPMAKYFNKLRDFYNERHKDELPFPYQSWNFQAGAWVDLRNKETGKGSGDAYHQVWDKTLAKLQRAGVSGIKDGKITRQAFMDPRFADALRGTLKPWRDAPKATVELGTKLTDVGKRAHELYEDAIAKGDELSQKEYLSGITTAMYASARGKGHPWERLKKAITGDVTSRGDITRIGHPTTDSPFEAGGTFEGTVSPNIRIPLKDMNKEHQEQFNAVAGKHLKQAAMAVSTILGAEQGSAPRPDHTRGHSVFVPTQEQISADHLRGFAGKLKTLGHETSFQRHPNGYQFDVMPKFNPDGSKEGIDEQTLNAAYRDTLAPHYGAGEIVPHDHDSAYTEAENYAEHRRNLVKRIRDEYLKQAADAGVGEKAATAALRAESPPKDFPGGGKKAWDVYRARHDHLASAEKGFKDLAKRVNDSHADFITRVEGRRAREAAAQAKAEAIAAKAAGRPQKAGGGAIDMGSTPYSTDAQGAPSGTAQRGKDALALVGSGGSSDAAVPGSGRDFLSQLANDPKTDGMTRFFAAGMAKSGTFSGQDPSTPAPAVVDPNAKPDYPVNRADGGAVVAGVRGALTPDLLTPKWRDKVGDNPKCASAGHCYAAAEAAYHMMGGPSGDYGARVLTSKEWPKGLDEGETHWYLAHKKTGKVVDPTHDQFDDKVPYHKGRPIGFLTKEPSKRAQTIIDRAARPKKADGGELTYPADTAAAFNEGLPAEQQVNQPKPPPSPSYIKPVDPDARKLSPLGLYSHAADEVWKQPQLKASPAQFKAMLTKRGVKPDEFKWSGYDQAFAGRDFVSKKEVRDHFVRNMPKIQETVRGDVKQTDKWGEPAWEDTDTKYHDYQLPGGKNYREVVLHLPPQKLTKLPAGYAIKHVNEFTPEERRLHGNGPYTVFGPAQGGGGGTGSFGSGSTPEQALRRAGVTLQESDDTIYKSSHWDEPNPLLHLRMSDREGPVKLKYAWRNKTSGNTTKTFDSADEAQRHLATLPEKLHGNLAMVTKPVAQKILHLEELQSDWGQAAREHGLKEDRDKQLNDVIRAERAAIVARQLNKPEAETLQAQYQAMADKFSEKTHNGVASAPYIDSTAKWTDLGLKRALHEAAKGGYDKVVVTPGEEQAKRYDLSQHISDIYVKEHAPDQLEWGYRQHGSHDWSSSSDDVHPSKLADHIGKEAADKIMRQKPDAEGNRHLSGLDLKVGGEGMKGYYDTILPKALEKLARQHDPEARVQPHSHKFISNTRKGAKGWEQDKTMLHALEVTPKMRASILAGQKGYASGGRVEQIADDNPMPWSSDPKAWVRGNYGHVTENVPIDWLSKLPGNQRRLSDDEYQQLKTSMQTEGIREPLTISVGKKSRTAQLGEGNHRLMIAKELGHTHMPARVVVGSEYGSDKGVRANYDHDLIPAHGEYFKSDASPSEVFKSLQGRTHRPQKAGGGRIGARIHDDIYRKVRKVVMASGSYPGSTTP